MGLNEREVLIDVKEARNIPNNDNKCNYGRVYQWSNESMEALFRNFSVRDKDVLTVVGSGDQVFGSLYNGANSVDTFDVNKLAIYYYFLRKWIIQRFGVVYPDRDFLMNKYNDLVRLVFSLKPDNDLERKASLFWMHYLIGGNNPLLFYPGTNRQESDFAKDIEGLRRSIKPVSFRLQDITEEYKGSKKYDVVILSNILEHVEDDFRYNAVRSNIERLLNDDGICVCSHLLYDSKMDDWYQGEIAAMTRGSLKHEEFGDWYLYNGVDYKQEVGYVYRKRR